MMIHNNDDEEDEDGEASFRFDPLSPDLRPAILPAPISFLLNHATALIDVLRKWERMMVDFGCELRCRTARAGDLPDGYRGKKGETPIENPTRHTLPPLMEVWIDL
jgi:hypothetical protein